MNKVINLSLSDTSTDCSQYCKLLLHSTPTSIRLCRVANIDLLVYLLSGYSKCVGREHCSVHDGTISSPQHEIQQLLQSNVWFCHIRNFCTTLWVCQCSNFNFTLNKQRWCLNSGWDLWHQVICHNSLLTNMIEMTTDRMRIRNNNHWTSNKCIINN